MNAPETHKRFLDDDERASVIKAALLLLVQDGHLRPNTFLTDESGNIRHTDASKSMSHPDRNDWWRLNKLQEELAAKKPEISVEEVIKSFCTQTPRDHLQLFREKGHFIQRVLQEIKAAGKRGEEVPINPTIARALVEITPRDRLPFTYIHSDEPTALRVRQPMLQTFVPKTLPTTEEIAAQMREAERIRRLGNQLNEDWAAQIKEEVAARGLTNWTLGK